MPKMLILRGNRGKYSDENGNKIDYADGALHEQAAMGYATRMPRPSPGDRRAPLAPGTDRIRGLFNSVRTHLSFFCTSGGNQQ
jgi:hypothetical protein